MKKKALSIVLIIAVFIATFMQNIAFQNNAYANTTSLKVGDYVSFGNYNGQSILWKVINLDSQGDPVLFAEQILSFKAFDASTATGSSKWETSHLRKWLNSEESKVNFGSTEPTTTAVYKGLNAYNNEAGFLSNFTSSEREILKITTNKVLLSDVTQTEKVGGTELHTGVFDLKINGAVANYDNAFYKDVNDKVFLLSVKELKQYVADRGYAVETKATTNAMNKEESEFSKGSNTEAVENYWLRTPTVTKGSEKPSDAVRIVTNKGDILDGCAYYGMVGVRPALGLQSIEVKSGEGTAQSPYVVQKKSTPSHPMQLSVGSSEVKVGETVSIPVTVSNVGNNGIGAFDLWLEYDSSVLEYQGVQGSLSGLEVYKDGNQIRSSFHNINPISNGTIFTLQFKAKAKTTTPVDIKVLEQSGQDYILGFYNKEENKYELSYTSGKVQVNDEGTTVKEGDIDGDGQVNSSDALLVIYFALGKQAPSENQRNWADLTKDGKINALDALKVIKIALSI